MGQQPNPLSLKTKQDVIGHAPGYTFCLDGNTGSMCLPYKWLYSLQEGWLLCVDGVMFEIVALIKGKSMPGKSPDTVHAVLEGDKGKRASLYLKSHRLALMVGRQSRPIVHATIVSKGGRDSDIIKVADPATVKAREIESTLAGLASGTTVHVNARKWVVLASEAVPVKPRSKVTTTEVYLRASNGVLATLRRKGVDLEITINAKPKRVRGIKVVK